MSYLRGARQNRRICSLSWLLPKCDLTELLGLYRWPDRTLQHMWTIGETFPPEYSKVLAGMTLQANILAHSARN